MPMRLYRVIMACLRCLIRVCIKCYCVHCALTETATSCHGNHCAPAALPLRPSAFALRLQNVETAMPLRCEQIQQICTKAASSLPPPLCVQALPTSSWLLNASQPSYSLLYPGPAGHVVHLIQIRRRRRPQGVEEFGYGNGWMATGGCSMVTIIGLCMSSGVNTLPVTLISSVCQPTCSTSFSADWVH